jgi:hypothetical protein
VLAGCARRGELIEGGITSVRTGCPAVGVPAGTGDITLFDPPASTAASAIDVTAAMTDVRSTCNETGDDIVTQVTFQVNARRTRTEGPRDVQLPYFLTVVQGGSAVVAKRVARVNLHFDAGQARATASGTATSNVNRAAATLPESVRERLTRRRKAGEEDAAVDPLTVPEVRSAVQRATFEALIGFQLTGEQLRYNATR